MVSKQDKQTVNKNSMKPFYSKNVIRKLIYGAFMGISDSIPGYSGGTTLTLLDAYDGLVDNFKGVLRPKVGFKRYEHFLWILPFIAMWGLVFVALHFGIKALNNIGFIDFLTIAFATFSFGCIPIFIMVNKPKVFRKTQWKNQLACGIGAFLVLTISVIIFVLELSKPQNDFANNQTIIDVFKNQPYRVITFVLAGFLGGFFMIIPGISGSMVVYLFNEYWTLNYLITDSIAHPFANANIAFLGLFGFLALIGMGSSIIFSSYMIQKNRELFYSFALGMIATSFIAILLVTPRETWTELTAGNGVHIGLACLAVIIGLTINAVAIYLYKKKNKKQNINQLT